MIDDELVLQQRDITGTTVHVCENCGRPVGGSFLWQVADGTAVDGGSGMRICPDCLEAFERGTAPVELDDEDDAEIVL